LEYYMTHMSDRLTRVIEFGEEVAKPVAASKLVATWKKLIDKRLKGYPVWTGRR
jgi:hypothetical protein